MVVLATSLKENVFVTMDFGEMIAMCKDVFRMKIVPLVSLKDPEFAILLLLDTAKFTSVLILTFSNFLLMTILVF